MICYVIILVIHQGWGSKLMRSPDSILKMLIKVSLKIERRTGH